MGQQAKPAARHAHRPHLLRAFEGGLAEADLHLAQAHPRQAVLSNLRRQPGQGNCCGQIRGRGCFAGFPARRGPTRLEPGRAGCFERKQHLGRRHPSAQTKGKQNANRFRRTNPTSQGVSTSWREGESLSFGRYGKFVILRNTNAARWSSSSRTTGPWNIADFSLPFSLAAGANGI